MLVNLWERGDGQTEGKAENQKRSREKHTPLLQLHQEDLTN